MKKYPLRTFSSAKEFYSWLSNRKTYYEKERERVNAGLICPHLYVDIPHSYRSRPSVWQSMTIELREETVTKGELLLNRISLYLAKRFRLKIKVKVLKYFKVAEINAILAYIKYGPIGCERKVIDGIDFTKFINAAGPMLSDCIVLYSEIED